ncbi:NAD(P)H-dependent oxidoreductase [Nitrosophilus kaiyonis]|uniref:NAD(P)H-dependent oxidoreductase n=1 Tax=Nitrosophilus kaiyonis TaxID=2930200 RepID=UPI002492ADB8|nr:NAD(P)H-dependent oxidoreductase [Nitrosophilus kaiyonis]
MNRKDEFLKMMYFRHACKIFDENRKIPKEDFDFILECARLSPSSFGMEPWRFLVITDQNLKDKLKPLCWNQKQINTCSHLVIIKAQKEILKPDSDYVKKMFNRRELPKEKIEAYLKRYKDFMQDKLDNEKLFCWSSKQCYIAAANMVDSAAFIGIDSCMIEGFEKDKVEELLNIDTKKEEIALLITFGYRVKPAPEKKRLSLEEIVEYKN